MDRLIALCLRAGKARVLAVVAIMIAIIAIADWTVGTDASLGVFYIVPMIVGAAVMPLGGIVLLALFCSVLVSHFGVPSSILQTVLHFAFGWAAYFGCGLFVHALVRNRELMASHLSRVQREQELRREAEEQLQLLVESSPAAILTLDGKGTVLAANRSASGLFTIPSGESLKGRAISRYLPVLWDAVRMEAGPEGFRTAAQCQGYRDNGEIFLANTWFSSYPTAQGTHLAAIVVDSSEEMRDREEQNFRQLAAYNRIAAAGVSHEVRNLCGAIAMVTGQLNEKHQLAGDADYDGLVNLVRGLEKIASLELQSKVQEEVELIPLRRVLDHLRIVIEPEWQEEGGTIHWQLPEFLPAILADPQGLLQAFLNLARNSYRAVRNAERRELEVAVAVNGDRVVIRFSDTGEGVPSAERLFQPFQSGANGAGLGLYISRAIVRSYGGDLRYEPRPRGSCFAVELQAAGDTE